MEAIKNIFTNMETTNNKSINFNFFNNYYHAQGNNNV